jgi:hypothetical protein
MSESEQRMPSDEEIAAAMAEQLRTMRVEELVASSLQTLLAVGYQRLAGGPSARPEDIAQAQLAIEAIRGLLPVAERFIAPEGLVQFRQALAELQMGYASAARAAGMPAEPPPPEQGPAQGPGPAQPQPPPRRSTIWTPGGEV